MMWYVILVIINSNGSATATAHYPKQPEYNHESNCQQAGKALAEEAQLKAGTNNAKVFWKCEALSYETIAKSMPKV